MKPRIVYFVVGTTYDGDKVIISKSGYENYQKTERKLKEIRQRFPENDYYIDSIEFIPEN